MGTAVARLRRLFLLTLTVCAMASGAAAQDEVATVRVDGRPVFQVGPATENGDARERARRVEQRIASLLRNAEHLGDAAPAHTEAGWTVMVSGVPVTRVTRRDAEDHLLSEAALARRWSTALDAALDRARDRRLGWGGRFMTETQAAAEAAFSRLGESLLTVVPRVLAAAFVMGLFWLVARGLRLLLRRLFRRVVEDVTVESLVEQFTYYAILALGFFVAVDALGFDPTTVAAGLGLTGVVLGFALKDVLSNFVSGLLLLALRPFEIGDQIVVGELEGAVERIELRATRLRAYDGRVMLVPNAEVFTARIINNTADPVRRGKVTAWLGYSVDLAQAARIARDAAASADGVLAEPPPVVRLDELGPADIALEVTFWTDSQRSDFKNTASAVRDRLIESFRAAAIALPDPDFRRVCLTDPDRADAGRDEAPRAVGRRRSHLPRPGPSDASRPA